MEILNNQISVSLSTPILISIGIVILLLIATLIYVSVKLKKATIYKPKFGFLGKTLYPVVTLLMIGVSIVLVMVSINSDKTFQLKAQKQLQADIFTNILKKQIPDYYIDLKTVPSVDGKIWGQEGDKFDIYWRLTGPKDYNFVELMKSNEQRSGIQEYIMPGNYKVTITVVFEESIYVFSKDVVF